MKTRSRHLWLALAVSASVALSLGLVKSTADSGQSGGTFKVAYPPNSLDFIDPALAYSAQAWFLLEASCAHLMAQPDKPPPQGYSAAPEVAAGYPKVSNGGKTFSFTIRPGFRFSDGSPVHASAFAHAIDRTLAVAKGSPAGQFVADIVGGAAVTAGKSDHASGVVANGDRLVVNLTAPAPDFPARTAMPFFCAVPPSLPSDPEGVGAFPGSGPYYVSEYVPGQRVVLKRNPYYRGRRPHHVDGFDVDLSAGAPGQVLDAIEAGRTDWGFVDTPSYFDPARGLARKYGTKGPRYYIGPGLDVRGFLFNMTSPLFRDNLALRRAVNFALDRRAMVNVPGAPAARPTDQFLPPHWPGFRDARIYPLNGPDLKRAKALARGQTRGGKVSVWTFDVPPAIAVAQVVKRNLKRIGLDVVVNPLPYSAYGQLAAPGAKWDMAFEPWTPDFFDSYQYINVLFDSGNIGGNNLGHFHSAKFDALMRHAARLQGAARYRAFGDVDVRLARDAAPKAQYAYGEAATLVSKRVGCVVLRPWLDLAATCLK